MERYKKLISLFLKPFVILVNKVHPGSEFDSGQARMTHVLFITFIIWSTVVLIFYISHLFCKGGICLRLPF